MGFGVSPELSGGFAAQPTAVASGRAESSKFFLQDRDAQSRYGLGQVVGRPQTGQTRPTIAISTSIGPVSAAR